jgi:hypothetical protein
MAYPRAVHWWIALWLAAAPGWGEFPAVRNVPVNPEPAAGSFERRAASDAMQAAIAQWTKERKEAARERARLAELRSEREALEAERVEGPAPEIERGPARAHSAGRPAPKVIEVAPEPTREQSEGWLEAEVKRRQEARAAKAIEQSPAPGAQVPTPVPAPPDAGASRRSDPAPSPTPPKR